MRRYSCRKYHSDSQYQRYDFSKLHIIISSISNVVSRLDSLATELNKLEKISNSNKTNRQVLNWISLAEKNRVPINCKYYNPRVTYDGYNFYLTVGLEDANYPSKNKNIKEQSSPIGLDLNISNIVTSKNDVYANINSSKKPTQNMLSIYNIVSSGE